MVGLAFQTTHDVAKKGLCNVDPDEIVTKQLTSRLKRVQKRIAELTAEAEMIDRMLATAARGEAKATLKLRKNSRSKWSVQGQTRRYLADHEGPVRAQAIYTHLRQHDPSLNSSTFRSHLRRMVDGNVIKREGSRGHYQLVERPNEKPEREVVRSWRPRLRTYYR